MTVNLTDTRMAALAAGAKPTSIETGTLAGLVRFGSPEHRKTQNDRNTETIHNRNHRQQHACVDREPVDSRSM